MKRSHFILIAIVLISLALTFGSLARGHVWPDDWAGYTLQAQSLIDGDPQTFIDRNSLSVIRSEIVIGPSAYPWGFPIMLAPFYAVCGIKPLCLKLINLPFFALTLIVFYFFLTRRLRERDALALTALFAFSPVMISANDFILSDIAFLFFFLLSIYLIDSPLLHRTSCPKGRGARGEAFLHLAIGTSIFLAFFIRTNGILLFGALIVVQFITWRLRSSLSSSPHPLISSSPYLLISSSPSLLISLSPYLLFSFLLLLSSFLPSGASSYLEQFNAFTIQGLFIQARDYLWIISDFFAPFVWKDIFYFVFAVFFLIGVFYFAKRESHLLITLLITYLVYAIWPYWQGLRFFYPLIPLFLYFAFQGMTRVFNDRFSLLPFFLLILLLISSLFISSSSFINNLNADRAINGPFDEYSAEMFAFARSEIPSESLIAFSHPRTLRLLTDRSGAVILDCDHLDQADYLILNKKREGMGDQISLNDVPSCNSAIDPNPLFENKRFVIYPISP
jgi:hypothetical protein